ncbi:hypothetical protein ACFLIM_38845 [Nonomuraea sp. M3C6]|uniref:Uncharacterized protein n=1 Tax=Nonomuraea marmarensis TaxID=3351344 RepID=A0ABW7ARY3_9ACTN
MSYGYGLDCSAARDAQRAADDVRHDVDMLSDAVARHRVNADSANSDMAVRVHELFEMIDALRIQVARLEQHLKAVEGR